MLIYDWKWRLAALIVDLSDAEKLTSIELPFSEYASSAESLQLALISVHSHSYDISFVNILDANTLFCCWIVKQTRRSVTGYLDSCSQAVYFHCVTTGCESHLFFIWDADSRILSRGKLCWDAFWKYKLGVFFRFLWLHYLLIYLWK